MNFTLYLERWYRTDPSGKVSVEVVDSPLVVIVISGKRLITQTFSQKLGNATIRLPYRSTVKALKQRDLGVIASTEVSAAPVKAER